MRRLIELILSGYRIYTKIRRKARINEVKENPTDAFADKFGPPELVLNDERVQSSTPSTEVDTRTERRSNTKQRGDSGIDQLD